MGEPLRPTNRRLRQLRRLAQRIAVHASGNPHAWGMTADDWARVALASQNRPRHEAPWLAALLRVYLARYGLPRLLAQTPIA